MYRKLDFGSGYNLKKGYKSCDIIKKPFLDYICVDNKILCEDNLFNTIHVRNVLHHIYNIEDIILEFNRVLKKNGLLIIIDVRKKYYKSNVILDILWYRYILPDYNIYISKKYRDYISVIKKYFKLVSKKYKQEKEITIFIKRS